MRVVRVRSEVAKEWSGVRKQYPVEIVGGVTIFSALASAPCQNTLSHEGALARRARNMDARDPTGESLSFVC